MSDDSEARPKRNANGQFLPGADWCGNAAGRPKGSISLLGILRDQLAQRPEGEDERTYAERIVAKTIQDALLGDSQSRKLVWEYIEGRPRQSVAITGGDGGPLEAEVTIETVISRYKATFEDALEEPGGE